MKICMVCGAKSDAETCPACGCADWAQEQPALPPANESPADKSVPKKRK